MRGVRPRGDHRCWPLALEVANFPFLTPSHKLALCLNEGARRKYEVKAWRKKTVRSKSKAL